MLDMSSSMPIFTTPSETPSWDSAANGDASNSAAVVAITLDLFIVASQISALRQFYKASCGWSCRSSRNIAWAISRRRTFCTLGPFGLSIVGNDPTTTIRSGTLNRANCSRQRARKLASSTSAPAAVAIHINTRFRMAEIGNLLRRSRPVAMLTEWGFPPVDFTRPACADIQVHMFSASEQIPFDQRSALIADIRQALAS